MKITWSIEEIKILLDGELGKFLAEKAGFEFKWGCVMIKGKPIHPATLCQSLDAIAEVEKIVIEKVGGAEYIDELRDVVDYDALKQSKIVRRYQIATASARQRSEACLLTLQNIEVKQ